MADCKSKSTNVLSTVHSDPSICASCAAKGNTCCHVAPGNEDLCFPLSEAEKHRIVSCCPTGEYVTETANNPEFLVTMHSLFPGEQAAINELFPADGMHLRLATNPSGFCLLLGNEGCILPREARPWFCKIFPFWLARGHLTAFDADYCLAVKSAITPAGMLKTFGDNHKNVLNTYNCLRKDWGLVPYVPGVVNTP